MFTRTRLLVAMGLALAVTAPAQAQDDNFWQNKWFWGAQGGSYLFKVGGSTEAAASVGGHWFVTAGRSALYLGFDQLFITSATTTLSTGRQVGFDQAQRIQASVYAMPSVSNLHIFLGGGFAIQHITDAEPMGTFATPSELVIAQNQIDDLSTKAFAVLGGGVQWHWLDRWAVFGQYQYMPASDDFLISSAQHTVFGGVRFALTTSKEAVAAND
jgi:hypothetical protein